MKLKRIVAFIIDWNIALLPVVMALSALPGLVRGNADLASAFALVMLAGIIGGLAFFVCRDACFKGRSLGKRLFGIGVYDRETFYPATNRQLIRRNCCFFIYPIEGLLLLFTGRTIGDSAAGTVVLSERNAERLRRMQGDALTSVNESEKGGVKQVILIAVAVVVFVAVLWGIVFKVLDAQKDTEEYKEAYSYLVSSEAFAAAGVRDEKIRLRSYSSNNNLKTNERTKEFGFSAGRKKFVVVGHFENGVWKVCEECTRFR